MRKLEYIIEEIVMTDNDKEDNAFDVERHSVGLV